MHAYKIERDFERKRERMCENNREEKMRICCVRLCMRLCVCMKCMKKKIKIQSNLIKEKVLSRRLVSYEHS